MLFGKKISLVLPCHNEEAGLRTILATCPKYIDEIVVVDNASTDNTAKVSREFGVEPLYEARKGYGAAYQTGLAAATGDMIATMDADNTYPLSDIEPMVKKLLEEGLDFVSGCRFPLKSRGSMIFLSRFGNAVTTKLSQILFNVPYVDFHTGMWVFKRSILGQIISADPGMAFSLELKLNAWKNPALRCGEYHIDYAERIGTSKYDRLADSFKCLAFVWRYRFSSSYKR